MAAGGAETEVAAGSSEDAGVGSGRTAGRRWWASAADGGEEKAMSGWAAGRREAAALKGGGCAVGWRGRAGAGPACEGGQEKLGAGGRYGVAQPLRTLWGPKRPLWVDGWG